MQAGVKVEEYFTSLSRRQTMLLLTSLTYGSGEALGAYQHLPEGDAELLTHRAQALLKIPREHRIPVLVQEITRLVTQRKRQLGSADPAQLAQALRGERAAMVEVVLRALPVDLADAVRTRLGHTAPGRPAREVRPEVLAILRHGLEDLLRRTPPPEGSFRFTDLQQLQARELLAVADRMGARVLATAVAGLSDEDRAAFLARLPPDQRSLATRASEAGHARRLHERDARVVLEMHGALEDPSRGMRSAGVQRVARACLAQSPEFAQRLVERHRGDLGRMLQRWVREERQRPVKGDGGRQDIVEQLERLAQKNILERPARPPPPAPARSPAPRRASSPSPAPFREPAPPSSPAPAFPWPSTSSPPPFPLPLPGASSQPGVPPWSSSPAPFRAPAGAAPPSDSLDRLAAELAQELAVPLKERRSQTSRESPRARAAGPGASRPAPPVPSPPRGKAAAAPAGGGADREVVPIPAFLEEALRGSQEDRTAPGQPRGKAVAALGLPASGHRGAPTASGGDDEVTPMPPLELAALGEDAPAARLPRVSAQAPARPSFPSYPGGPSRSRDAGRVLRDGRPLADPFDATPVPGTSGRHRSLGGVRSPVVKGPGRG